MKVHQEANSISFQIPAAFLFSDSTGRRDSHKPPPLSLFISTYPLLRWPTLKQEQRARYWKTSWMLGSVYSLGDLFNLRKSERSSESRFSGKASSDSSSSQHDDRTSERHNDWAIDHRGRRKELKYTHNMTKVCYKGWQPTAYTHTVQCTTQNNQAVHVESLIMFFRALIVWNFPLQCLFTMKWWLLLKAIVKDSVLIHAHYSEPNYTEKLRLFPYKNTFSFISVTIIFLLFY